jgi:hypothetical protein
MNSDGRKPGDGKDPVENEVHRRASERDGMGQHYGRRIETDRTWTVYHVFTGEPANVRGHTMVGLGQMAATDRMLSMNLRNVGRRNERITLDTPRLDASEIDVPGWL